MKKLIARLLSYETIKNNLDFIKSFVSNVRIEKANKLINEKDKLLSLGGGYLLKKYLQNDNIEYLKNGKPYLKGGPYFNLSHSNEYVVFVLSDVEIGIDIEFINEKKEKAIKYVLNENETGDFSTFDLFRIWTNKESLIKCQSSGIVEIKNAPGLPFEGKRMFKGEAYYTKSTILDGYSLSISVKSEEPFMFEIEKEMI